jgi:hypothetical protein
MNDPRYTTGPIATIIRAIALTGNCRFDYALALFVEGLQGKNLLPSLRHPELARYPESAWCSGEVSTLLEGFKTGLLMSAPDWGPFYGVGLSPSGEVVLYAQHARPNVSRNDIFVSLKPPASEPVGVDRVLERLPPPAEAPGSALERFLDENPHATKAEAGAEICKRFSISGNKFEPVWLARPELYKNKGRPPGRKNKPKAGASIKFLSPGKPRRK